MIAQKSLRRLAIFLLISLILALSVQMILDHHICSDHHCTLCQLIRSFTERTLLMVAHWSVLSAIVLTTLCLIGSMVSPALAQSPVQQKVKITC